jgi:hypothetical protein
VGANLEIALRGDTEGDPRSGEGVRPSSHSIQIAKQNRSTGTPVGRSGDSASARPPAEHAVWHSEVNRKEALGGVAPAHTTRHVFLQPSFFLFFLLFFVLLFFDLFVEIFFFICGGGFCTFDVLAEKNVDTAKSKEDGQQNLP